MATNSPRRKALLWLGLTAAGLALWVIWAAAERVSAVAAIQDAVRRDWEIAFWEMKSGTNRPPGLPAWLDSTTESWFERTWEHTAGYSGSKSPKASNRGSVYHERFRSLFRGPMRDIHIFYPETFRGGALGTALCRFPKLRRVSVVETDAGPTESDWTLLATHLRELPDLETIELCGYTLTDAAIAPLAGHPKLRSIHFNGGRLTMECVKTLASLPSLATLHIEGQQYDGDAWLSVGQKQEMVDALPGVAVELP